MKKYYNPTTKEWYFEGNSITKRIDNGVFSGIPTKEQLLSWGFEEYIEPAPTPEQQLAIAKENKLSELIQYDESSAVNSFTLGDKQLWIAPNERTNYELTLEAAQEAGISTIPFLGYTIEVGYAISIIKSVSIYAMQCVGVTDAHKNAINTLETIEAVEAYDFTVGYPEKLVFSVSA